MQGSDEPESAGAFRRRLFSGSLIAGCIGVVFALALGRPVYQRSAQLTALDRDRAVAAARDYLASRLVDTAGFQGAASFFGIEHLDGSSQTAIMTPDRAVARYGWLVWLKGPRAKTAIDLAVMTQAASRAAPRVQLDARRDETQWWIFVVSGERGRPQVTGLRRTLPELTGAPKISEAQARAIAAQFVARYGLLNPADYRPPDYSPPEKSMAMVGHRLTWESPRPAPGTHAARPTLELSVLGLGLISFGFQPGGPSFAADAPLSQMVSRDLVDRALMILRPLLWIVLLFVALLTFFRGYEERRRLAWKAGLAPAAVFVGLSMLAYLGQRLDTATVPASVSAFTPVDYMSLMSVLVPAVYAATALLFGVLLYLFWVAGDGILRSATGAGVALGRPDRCIAQGTGLGLAISGALVLVAYVARLVGVETSPATDALLEVPNAGWPVLMPLAAAASAAMTVEVTSRVVAYSWAGAKFGRTCPAIIVSGIAWAILGGWTATEFRPTIVLLAVMLLLGSALGWIYARSGLLTMLAAGTVAGTWGRALPFLYSPSPSLASAALGTLAVSLLLPLAVAALAWLRLRAHPWTGADQPQPFEEQRAVPLPPLDIMVDGQGPAAASSREEQPSAASSGPVRAFGLLEQSTVGLVYLLLFLLLACVITRRAMPETRDLLVVSPFLAICSVLLPTWRLQRIGLSAAIALSALSWLLVRQDVVAAGRQTALAASGLVLSCALLGWSFAPPSLRSALAHVVCLTVMLAALAGFGVGQYHRLSTEVMPLPIDSTAIQWSSAQKSARVTGTPDVPGGEQKLRVGDQIIAVNGIEVSSDWAGARSQHDQRRARVGRVTSYVAQRDGQQISLRYTARGLPAFDWSGFAAQLLAAALCAVLACLVIWRRPLDAVSWLFAGLNVSLIYLLVGQSLSVQGENSVPAAKFGWLFVVGTILAFGTSFFLHFFLVFPEPKRVLQRYPALLYLVYLPGVLACAAEWAELGALDRWVDPAWPRAIGALWVLLGLVSMVHAYFTVPHVVAKRQIRVVFLAVAAIPPVIMAGWIGLAIWILWKHRGDFAGFAPQTFLLPLRLPIVLLPAAFAYAIIRHRAMNLNLIVRRAIVYAAAVGVVVILFFSIEYTLGSYVQSLGERTSSLLSLGGTFLLASLLAPLKTRVEDIVDRRLHRERYVFAERVQQFVEETADLSDRDALLESALVPLDTLGVEHAAVCLRQGAGGFTVAASRGYPEPRSLSEVRLAAGEGSLAEALLSAKPSLSFYDPEHSRAFRRLPAPDQESLRALGAVICLPLLRRGSLVGILCLGAKRSGDAYDRGDLAALTRLAGQVAVSLEALQAHETAGERDEEMERAVRMHQALLPEQDLVAPSLEVAGFSLPARRLGGDYFDHIVRPDGTVVVAVGDAGGHGLAAVAPLSIAKATLPIHLEGGGDLAGALRLLNRALRSPGPEPPSLQLLLAELDPPAGRLRLAAAGDLRLLRYAASPGSWSRVTLSGQPLGTLSDPSYGTADYPLEPGDVWVLASDGAEDLLASQGGSSGRDGFAELISVAAPAGGEASTVRDEFRATIDRARGGQPLSDDVTMVVVRFVGPLAQVAEASAAEHAGEPAGGS
jgi:sigma-B regulation protein RsbU (phosphoserine phosphatase)